MSLRGMVTACAVLLAACSSTPMHPATYTVKRGDTLYSIAWRHQLDFRDVARWNRIGRDYMIHPGQVLKLQAPGGRPPQSATARAPLPKPPPASATSAATTPPVGPAVQWQWPVRGGTATLTWRPNGGQGLMIGGQLGQEIRAAGPGRVVYLGTGLLGYGQLVIVKHGETYLSAYGHTQTVVVHEGDTVVSGQRIATMGAAANGAATLYFEIRINGAPVNPLLLLPQQR